MGQALPFVYETEGHRFESCRARSPKAVDSAQRCEVLRRRRDLPNLVETAVPVLKPNRTIAQTSPRASPSHGVLPTTGTERSRSRSRRFESGPRYVRQGDRLLAQVDRTAVPIRPVVPGTARDASLAEIRGGRDRSPIRRAPFLDLRRFLRYSNIRRGRKRLGDAFRGQGEYAPVSTGSEPRSRGHVP